MPARIKICADDTTYPGRVRLNPEGKVALCCELGAECQRCSAPGSSSFNAPKYFMLEFTGIQTFGSCINDSGAGGIQCCNQCSLSGGLNTTVVVEQDGSSSCCWKGWTDIYITSDCDCTPPGTPVTKRVMATVVMALNGLLSKYVIYVQLYAIPEASGLSCTVVSTPTSIAFRTEPYPFYSRTPLEDLDNGDSDSVDCLQEIEVFSQLAHPGAPVATSPCVVDGPTSFQAACGRGWEGSCKINRL